MIESIHGMIIEKAAKELKNEVDKMVLEEKEMEFIHNIKNVDAVDIEFLPDDSQIRLQVGAGEDIYMFLLEGEAAKNYAKNYGERCCRLIRDKHDLEKLNDKLKMDNHELIMKYNTTSAEKYHFKKERDKLFEKHNVLVMEYDTLLEKYKEQEAKIDDLNIEKARLKKRNKELNQQIDEMVLNANKKKEEADEEPHSRRDILRCAEKCVCGKREQDYGTPESNFKLIADLWNGYLFPSLEYNKDVITPLDVAMMMALLKIARIRNGGGTGDSFVDLAGYAACGGEINAQKKATETN